MRGLLLRWLILTFAIMTAAYLFSGIHVNGFGSALIAALVLGILNAFFAGRQDYFPRIGEVGHSR